MSTKVFKPIESYSDPTTRGGPDRSEQQEREIASLLNVRGITTDRGSPWTRGMVHQVLINDKYVGNNVWNRISYKLKNKRVRNSPDLWIRADAAFEPP